MLLNELQDAHTQLSTIMNSLGDGSLLTLSAVDAIRGRLLIGTTDPWLEPAIRSTFKDIVGDLPLSCQYLRFRRHGKQQMNRPLSGGLKIVRVAGHNVEVGSIGVIVRRHNVLGFVTAGHVAGSINERIFQPRHSDTNYVGKTKHVSNYTGTANSDSAFVEIEGAQANEGAIWKDDQSFIP